MQERSGELVRLVPARPVVDARFYRITIKMWNWKGARVLRVGVA